MSASHPVQISQTARSIGSYPIAEIAEKKQKLLSEGMLVFDFGPGDDPLPIDSVILQSLRERLPVTSMYPNVRGTAPLREAISGYLSRRFGVSAKESQIIPVSGSKEGIFHLPLLFIDQESKRRKVIGPALYYPPYLKGTQAVFGEYVPVSGGAEEQYLLNLEELPPSLLNETALVYLNYPHNPTGATCTLDYLKRQVEVAHKYGCILVSDECYADIYFGNSPPPSALQVTDERVLVFHSLSKRSGLTGFRSGFVAGDEELVKGYAALRNAIGTAPPEPINIVALAAWSDDDHVEERREIFRAIRARFFEFFDEIGLSYLSTDATFYLWVKAPDGQSGKSYAELLQKHGIFVGPADFFGEGSREWFRVSLVLPIEQCEQAFEVWRKV